MALTALPGIAGAVATAVATRVGVGGGAALGDPGGLVTEPTGSGSPPPPRPTPVTHPMVAHKLRLRATDRAGNVSRPVVRRLRTLWPSQ